MEDMSVSTLIGVIGFALGLVFGAIGQRTDFCTMGSISDIVFMGSWNRFRAWVLAIAVAMLASQA
ncbi:MAG: YeeE/YedE thiosulfate transporter family protein, partial [Boseongicola sp.]|nr:YeeE/YedE thiosulfate transporter family protein [Boseongicola sp.]